MKAKLLNSLLLLLPVSAAACSMQGCLGNGPEFSRNLELIVKHDGKPLPGVHVTLTGTRNLELSTGLDGKAKFTSLAPGNYWLSTDLFGISAGGECFHISKHRSIRAKRSLKYDWGDLAPSYRLAAGKLVDSQSGTGGSLIWNVTHRVSVPISGAVLTLRSQSTRESLDARSALDGTFSYGDVPHGTYVLHVERRETTGGILDSDDLLFKVSADAARDTLKLLRTQSMCGTGFDMQ